MNEVIAALQVDLTDENAKGIAYFLLHFLRWLSLRLNTGIAASVTSERGLTFSMLVAGSVYVQLRRVYIDIYLCICNKMKFSG